MNDQERQEEIDRLVVELIQLRRVAGRARAYLAYCCMAPEGLDGTSAAGNADRPMPITPAKNAADVTR